MPVLQLIMFHCKSMADESPAGYIIGQVPGHYLIQRLPMRVYITGTVFLWAVLVFLHCAAFNYGGLIPIRFFLGITEATMLPALEITMAMFFTPEELHQLQPIFWISCVGSVIPAGLLGYGLLWSKSTVSAWKFFMIVTGGITFLLSILTWFTYPNNPATAWFLTTEERVHVIRRVHAATKSSIEQKQFKRYQLVEAFRDPVSWLFATIAFALMLANNLAFQQSLLFLDLGVAPLGSTLVWVASGGFAIAVAFFASFLLYQFKGLNAYWGALWALPAVAGCIGMMALSWDKTLALLACILLASNTWGMTWIITVGWTSSSCAGHTKKLARNGLVMAAYGVSNLISPQLWRKGAPRYYGTWATQLALSFTLAPVLLIVIRFVLISRNKERKAWIAEQEASGNSGHGYIERVDEKGETTRTKVDISLLDLTDLENKFFLYPL